MRARLVLPVASLLLCASCGGDRSVSPAGASPTSEAQADWFVDRAEASGLKFTHVNGMEGKFYYAEVIAPGTALFDYDHDGDLDVYLVQGGMLGTESRIPSPESRFEWWRSALSERPRVNEEGTRTLRFTDVTAESGIASRGYGMGVATGDFNNDGCVDLYLTSLGPNQLFRNNCNGTLRPTYRGQAGTDDPSWSVSAAFLDYDRDGWLDLFVGNYLSWRVDSSTPCFTPSGRPDYCSPNVYQPQPSRLLHNNRDGTFTDVTTASGIAREFGPALGVSTADFNGDGWIDLYVANDGQPNLLWINQRNGTFKNTGLLSGTALSSHGKAKAGMGVDAGDFDNDGDEDLFVTNLTGEGNDLYVNDGSGLFDEQSARSGLGGASRGYTGFGTAWFDIDNDGWLDTLTVNGAVQTIEALRRVNDPFPLHQRKLLFRNPGTADDSRMSPRAAVLHSSYPRLAAAPRSATSTMTATSTCWWPTTTDQLVSSPTKSAAEITGSGFGLWGKPNSQLPTSNSQLPTPNCLRTHRLETCSAPASASFETMAQPSRDELDRMEATRRQAIRECSWDLANRPVLHACESCGRAARPKSGARWPSIATPLSQRAAGSEPPLGQRPTPNSQLPKGSRPVWKLGVGSWRLGVVICLLTLVVSGCDSRREPPAQTPALPPVSLPDLSQMDKAVQQQIGDSYRTLTSFDRQSCYTARRSRPCVRRDRQTAHGR